MPACTSSKERRRNMLLAAARCWCYCSHKSPFRSLHFRLLSPLQTQILPSSTTSTYSFIPKRSSSVGGSRQWVFHAEMGIYHPVEWKKMGGRMEFSTDACVMSEIEDCSGYISVEIRCQKHVADVLSEALLCFGASSASIAGELSSCVDDGDEICISLIFTIGKDVHQSIIHAVDSIGLKSTPSYKVSVNEEPYNWLKNAEESFHPIEVGNGLWIVPQWRPPPEPGATNIILNPGMAFGTGEHPTTLLCLLLLRNGGLLKGGERVLDYGTGSGILGIAALKLGASLVVGVDIDPQAISSAQQNMTSNQIEADKMELYLGSRRVTPPFMSEDDSSLSAKKENFDIILANIVLKPLLELAEEIVSYGKPGAIIGLSGILTEQLPQIEECYSRYLERITISEMDGWACFVGTKKMEGH